MNEKLLDARRMTFGANWPHENKRGWICKTEKMVGGGWYYCPTPESDDLVRCCYCNLSLDGWESKDDPHHEHQRRSPDCIFFVLSTSKSKKTARAKKGHGSKTSRISTQSNLTTASEDLSMVDVNSIPETSVMYNVELSGAKKVAKGAKQGTKGRKAAPKSKGKACATQEEEVLVGSSFVEPEEDDFQVKIQPETTHNDHGKKRKSDEMSVDGEPTQAGSTLDHSQFPLPPPKRRATRASASYGNKDPISTLEFTLGDDTHMEDCENIPPPPQPKAKKTGKGGRKRASSSVRKASTASAATKASLRAAVPDDEEIDAALEADLDRPLTDDEVDVEPPPLPKTKTRRLTKTRPGSRKVTASTAPIRTTRASTLPLESDSMISTDIPTRYLRDEAAQETEAVEIALKAVEHAKEEIIAETAKSIASKAKTRGRAPSKTTRAAKGSEKKTDTSRGVQISQPAVGESEITIQEPTEPKSMQAPDRLPANLSPTSETPAGDTVEENIPEGDSSLLARPTAYDEPDNESSTIVKSQTRVRGGGKQRAGTAAENGKASKKGPPEDREFETMNQVKEGCSRRISQEHVVELETQHNDQVIETATLPNQLTAEEIPRDVEKASKPKRGRPGKAKAKPRKPSTESSFMEPKEPNEALTLATNKQIDMAEEPPVTDHEVRDDTHAVPPQAATPHKIAPSVPGTPKTVISPPSSDAENQPPSSRPSALRPPLSTQSPSKAQNTRVVLAATTPTASPGQRNISRLQSMLPWTSIDFEKLFMASPAAEKENISLTVNKNGDKVLTSPEKRLTVEEWILSNAQRGEDKLRDECERLVGRFEGEGVRALKTLEGIVCTE
ncbi:hypothetical protein XANCAGTX0491_004331 [Xanthoria calcicola]